MKSTYNGGKKIFDLFALSNSAKLQEKEDESFGKTIQIGFGFK